MNTPLKNKEIKEGDLLNILKMGYFILYKSDGKFFSRQIEKHQLAEGHIPQRACYTHIEVSGGGSYSVAVYPPKTKIIDIEEKCKGRYICVVKYKGKQYEERKRYKVAFWAATLCNLYYDWFGVLKFKIGWLFHFRNRYFCSENAAYALQQEYPEALGKDPYGVLPADFLLPKQFEVVWEGLIS